jgi:hypothetical protein
MRKLYTKADSYGENLTLFDIYHNKYEEHPKPGETIELECDFENGWNIICWADAERKKVHSLYMLKGDKMYLKFNADTKDFNPVDFKVRPAPVTSVVCECGGEKTKTGHSTWCPKYER